MDDTDKLTVLWAAIQVVLLLYVAIAWLGAAGGFVLPSCGSGDADTAIDHHEAFALVWHSLMAIAVSVGGTLLMKKHRTATGLGLFVGAIFMMINWTLTTLVLLGGQVHKKAVLEAQCPKDGRPGTTADVLCLLLGVLLFLLYIAFEALLIQGKDRLISEAPPTEYPSAAFSSIDQQQQEALTAV